jgi:hypothetical protein
VKNIKISLEREKSSFYKKRSFQIIQEGSKVGYIQPNEIKEVEIEAESDILIKIDSYTGVKISKDQISEKTIYRISPVPFFALSPIIWILIFIIIIFIPSFINNSEEYLAYLVAAALITYIPLPTVLRYNWLRISTITVKNQAVSHNN